MKRINVRTGDVVQGFQASQRSWVQLPALIGWLRNTAVTQFPWASNTVFWTLWAPKHKTSDDDEIAQLIFAPTVTG